MSVPEKKEIILFSIIVISLSSLICYVSYKTDNSNLSILSVFTPSVLALVFTAIKKGKKGVYDLFIQQTIEKTSIHWLLLSLIGIPILGTAAVLTSLNFDMAKFSLRTYQLMPQIAVIILIAFGEEYGWRGFLLPRLMTKFNLFYSSLILGLIWGFWHFPAYLIGTGVPLQMNFMVFLVWVILGTLFISWIYYYTTSVFTSILAHISANATFNYLFILPEFTGSMNTFFIFMLYLSIVMTIVFYVSRKDLLKRNKMNFKLLGTTIILFFIVTNVHSQKKNFPLSAEVTIDKDLTELFLGEGRLYLFLSQNPNQEPRTRTWPSPGSKAYIFAKNFAGLKSDTILNIENDENWISTSGSTLNEIPAGEYYVQILWDQDLKESRINAPGNLFSEIQKLNINQSTHMKLALSKFIEAREVKSHELSRVVDFKSEVLSTWWNKPVHLKASVLLPHGYDSKKAYPIRYNVAGYGGRYTRINYTLNNENFMKWWDSDEAPQIITVYLDGEGPFGDSYQMDSENSGPYGKALINEFIPYIESEFRGTNSSTTRFVDGCSTGGWVSLGLQLYYPDFFNGVYSYSPDAVEFENYQLINIYKDKNAFVNEYGYSRPVMRSTKGEPMLSLKEFIQYENVLGSSNSYLNSGGQFSAHTALYSPKGKDGLPKALFDPITGDIDPEVAQHWKKYDFKIYAQQNWEVLGPKLQGKIFIWMGDMDNFYLNPATREFADFLSGTLNPQSDANIIFSPMEGHCSQYSHKEVLLKIQERIDRMN